MLSKLEAYSAWDSAPTLPLSDSGREETDLIQIRNIDGLDPVKATINTSPFGSVDGVAYTGANVPYRNIVLTLHPNPDWDSWSYESLRRLVYRYFMPKLLTKLIFYTDDKPPVEIYGYVEDCSPNIFSKDPEITVSIICPDPYFTAVDATVITGISTDSSHSQIVTYDGDIPTGFNVEVTHSTNPDPTAIGIQVGDPSISFFNAAAAVNPNLYFEMNSLPGAKYVRNVALGSGVITNLLPKMAQGSSWPVLNPGDNPFSVITDTPGNQNWQLTYYDRYGGL